MPSPAFSALLDQYMNEGNRLANTEDGNSERLNRFAQDEFKRAHSTPTITEGDIDTLASRSSADAANEANDLFKQARAGLGEAGITGGGHALSTGSEIALRRMGQVSGKRADLRLFKIQADAQDRISRIRDAFSVTQTHRGPSAMRHDTLGEGLGATVGMEGIEAGERAASKKAKADKQAGVLGFVSNIFAGL